MKKMIAICSIELALILKKPQSYLMMFAAPLLLTFVFGGIMGSGEEKLKLAIVDLDDTLLSQHYIKQLRTNDDVYSFENMPESEAKKKLKQKKIAGVIMLPVSFQTALEKGQNPNMTFLHGPELAEAQIVQQYAESSLSKVNIQVTAAKEAGAAVGGSWKAAYKDVIAKNTDGTKSEVRRTGIDDQGTVSNTAARAAGFAILFVMLTMISSAGTILEARKNGIWTRLFTTPASRAQISAGYLLSFFIIGWLQFGILLLATHWIFGVSWGDPLAVIILVSLFLLAIVGIGLMIAALVKTPEQQMALGNLFVIATCMVSGMYWPIEIEPKLMQSVAEFLPQKWAMNGFTDIIANDAHISDVLGIYGILLAFAAVFFAAGVKALR
ncbi:ABC transporter permease [Bacillus atrophaeus]|uniref:ABC transporter permease n=1 Tax=Bacillus atrophaeus TaxID=1452 RepID=UPI002282F14C|nr:ABC transporter permease [Bacillus atrophaeus]MCY8514854.1 ABC transporter permease [Bacillus atrophaeus]MCY8990935.1 ABC transporter permease [Bacillus atrophaeus]